MPIDPVLVAAKLAQAAVEPVADTRGKLLEAVAEHMFAESGCTVRSNMISPLGAEQIDLAVAHFGSLGPVPTFFLVECKFWEKPVDSAAVGYFLNICSNRRVRLGVIVSRVGITGDKEEASRAHSLAISASARGVNLIVLAQHHLESVKSSEEFVELLLGAWMEAAATGGVGYPA